MKNYTQKSCSPPCPICLLTPVPTSCGSPFVISFLLSFQFLFSTGKYEHIVLFSPFSYQKLTSYCQCSAPCFSHVTIFPGDLIIRNHRNTPSSFPHSCVLFQYGCTIVCPVSGAGCFQSFAITNHIIVFILPFQSCADVSVCRMDSWE